MIGIICALKIEVEGIHNMMSNPQIGRAHV